MTWQEYEAKLAVVRAKIDTWLAKKSGNPLPVPSFSPAIDRKTMKLPPEEHNSEIVLRRRLQLVAVQAAAQLAELDGHPDHHLIHVPMMDPITIVLPRTGAVSQRELARDIEQFKPELDKLFARLVHLED